MSIICPLITSALLHVVKALHGRCPYHCIMQKIHKFRGLALTKLTIFTVVSKTSFKLSGIPLAARASRWMLQCTQVASGVTTPLCLPVMAFAPSVQIPTWAAATFGYIRTVSGIPVRGYWLMRLDVNHLTRLPGFDMVLFLWTLGGLIVFCQWNEATTQMYSPVGKYKNWLLKNVNNIQCLVKVFGPLELCDLLPHFRLQT